LRYPVGEKRSGQCPAGGNNEQVVTSLITGMTHLASPAHPPDESGVRNTAFRPG
jgi:hypothetical protein